MDLRSRMREIVRSTRERGATPSTSGLRELTYEPDRGYEALVPAGLMEEALGGRTVSTRFGNCLTIDRRYESDRRHGDVLVGECEPGGCEALRLLDPALTAQRTTRTVFMDLETTGLSGGAGTMAFLVGCGYFDLGAFQVRQFLLTSHAAERAMLAAVAEFIGEPDLIVTFNGKTFDLPVMESRWNFHRLSMPLEGVPHFDVLHPARRLWSSRTSVPPGVDAGCRLTALERALLDYRRASDVPATEIPSRYFRFIRTGDPRPLEPVLEHNRLDLVSLAAVTARAVRLVRDGPEACRNGSEALALGRLLERAGDAARAEECYGRAIASERLDIQAEAFYRLGLRFRRTKRFEEATQCWHAILSMTGDATGPRHHTLGMLRAFAIEALAIHNEHRARNFTTARELALSGLEEAMGNTRRAEEMRHRISRLDRKLKRTPRDPAQITLLPPPAASSPSPPPFGFPTSGRRTAS